MDRKKTFGIGAMVILVLVSVTPAIGLKIDNGKLTKITI